MSLAASVTPPGERFNIAQHLLALNQARAGKTAFIDDHGSITYGELDECVRRMATGLRALGLRREERVMILMHDSTDWPVSYLGAMYAGLVPVAVNTLLTAHGDEAGHGTSVDLLSFLRAKVEASAPPAAADQWLRRFGRLDRPERGLRLLQGLASEIAR